MEATVFTTSSGADVPNETMVSPITKSETLCFFASAEAPVTSQSAPLMSSTNPATMIKTDINIDKNFITRIKNLFKSSTEIQLQS